MKIATKDKAVNITNSNTSKLLEYSIELNDKEIGFVINTIISKYDMKKR